MDAYRLRNAYFGIRCGEGKTFGAERRDGGGLVGLCKWVVYEERHFGWVGK